MGARRDPLLRAFRDAVRKKIARDLDAERQRAESLRKRVVPAAEKAIGEARRQGLCSSAWIFGSYAWGEPLESSDLDLMVEGCADPDGLAAMVARETGTNVHVVTAESAPEGLRERVLGTGARL